jgi:hypothetical protein
MLELIPCLADMKLEPEGAVWVVGKLHVEEKEKLKD